MKRFLCVLGCIALALISLSPYNKASDQTASIGEAHNAPFEENEVLSNEPQDIESEEHTDLAAIPEIEPTPFPKPGSAYKPGSKNSPEAYQDSIKKKLYVLMYHSIAEDGSDCNEWTTTVSCFREDLKWLTDNGYSFVLPSELALGAPLPEKAVMITFDDGYVDNYTLAYPILKEFQAKAVISPVVIMLDDKYKGSLSWDMCREMAASGLVEFGSHTFSFHEYNSELNTYGIQRGSKESREEYETRIFTDIQRSIEELEENIGQQVFLFAYPHGKKESWASDFIQEHFAITLITVAAPADISKGLYSLPRYNINTENRPWLYMK